MWQKGVRGLEGANFPMLKDGALKSSDNYHFHTLA